MRLHLVITLTGSQAFETKDKYRLVLKTHLDSFEQRSYHWKSILEIDAAKETVTTSAL